MGLWPMVGVGVVRMSLENYILFHETKNNMQDCGTKKHYDLFFGRLLKNYTIIDL